MGGVFRRHTTCCKVNPLAIVVMQEIGVDISIHTPHHVQEYLSESWDYVITVCCGANESCPQFVGHVRQRLHIGFDDPSNAVGTEEFILSEFRRVRDEIHLEMRKLFK